MAQQPKKQYYAKVGVVYSENDGCSLESKHSAFFLAAQLTSKGYCEVVFVGHRADGSPSPQALVKERILYKNPGQAKAMELPAGLISFCHWDAIEACDLVVVTANSDDTLSISRKLQEVFASKKDDKKLKIPVFSIQRGVKNSTLLKDEITEQHRAVVLECVLNFTVIPDTSGVLCVSNLRPRLLVERLSKDIEKVASGPLDLLESCDVLEFYFDKNLTQYAWGVLLFDNLSALNTITGGTLKNTLSDSNCRKILAYMMREARLALIGGSGGRGWQPTFGLVFSKVSLMSPWLWEMVLHLPYPLFVFACFLFIGNIDQSKSSHYRWDLENGRSTTIAKHLGEIVETGKRYGAEVKISNQILCQIILYEDAVREGKKEFSNFDFDMGLLRGMLPHNKSKVGSDREFLYYISRMIVFLVFIPVLYFVLFL